MSMETALTTNRRDPGFWRELWQQARLVWYLLRDREVPFYLKFLPFAAIFYVIWPIDLIPGIVAPVVGTLDDMTVLLVGFKVFIELSPQHVVVKHLNAIRERDGYPPLQEDHFGAEPAVADEAIIIDGEIVDEGEDKA